MLRNLKDRATAAAADGNYLTSSFLHDKLTSPDHFVRLCEEARCNREIK
jgi:hypothetical protein